eukprot:TRINITY_DN14121_c0_g1_i1.p1 TRINITY_DN14121_c0_g1~~TRINITY_DN14121_c0_g1_i1.p1  ORF type:complete len:184 (-),score=40.18 TRINITY_DN14121_c0_g1_i1:317-868(-)
MSKYDRWGRASASAHGGFAPGPSVAQSAKLDALLPEFKAWFESVAGFGDYLKTFYEHYASYLDSYHDEHSLMYTQIHKEFVANLEQCIDQWLHSKGLSEDDFGEMLGIARARGDVSSSQIIDKIFSMVEYQQWFAQIFDLRRSLLEAQSGMFEAPMPPPLPPSEEVVAGGGGGYGSLVAVQAQ